MADRLYCERVEQLVPSQDAKIDRYLELETALALANKLGIRLHEAGLTEEHNLLRSIVSPLAEEKRLIKKGRMSRWRPAQ